MKFLHEWCPSRMVTWGRMWKLRAGGRENVLCSGKTPRRSDKSRDGGYRPGTLIGEIPELRRCCTWIKLGHSRNGRCGSFVQRPCSRPYGAIPSSVRTSRLLRAQDASARLGGREQWNRDVLVNSVRSGLLLVSDRSSASTHGGAHLAGDSFPVRSVVASMGMATHGTSGQHWEGS